MFKVGDIVTIGKPCLNNPAGSHAICYEVYEIGGKPGYSFIFPNGLYDGFSEKDISLFDVNFFIHCQELSNYKFKNVLKLEQDFRLGTFKIGFDLIKRFEKEKL